VQGQTKTGVKRDGTWSRWKFLRPQPGAYGDIRRLITCGHALQDCTACPILHGLYGVYTNTAFQRLRVTASAVAWAHETQMDIIADALGIDPLDLRLKNAFTEGDRSHWRDGNALQRVNRSAVKKIGWKNGPLVVRVETRLRQRHAVIVKAWQHRLRPPQRSKPTPTAA
jgi:hypothetical protein